jgi:acyl-coenzyme A thioesterase PaaI-like protein
MKNDAFQDHYPDELAHCYGCGRLNEHGHQLRTTWDGDETVTHFTPEAHHIAIPGYVYGGLIASIIDCHCTGTAAAAAAKNAGRELDDDPAFRFVTASLQVDYLRPTPLGPTLEVRGSVEEVSGRKVVIRATVSAEGEVCARGRVVAVQMPEHLAPNSTA